MSINELALAAELLARHGVTTECGHQRRAGSGRFAAVLAARPAWRRPARSDHELGTSDAPPWLPPLVREHRLVLHDGELRERETLERRARVVCATLQCFWPKQI